MRANEVSRVDSNRHSRVPIPRRAMVEQIYNDSAGVMLDKGALRDLVAGKHRLDNDGTLALVTTYSL